MSAIGKGPAPRLGTPLSSNQERSNAPSPSPAPFDPSDVGGGVIPGSSRAPFGSGRGGLERAGSPLKRYTSTSASRQANPSTTPTAPSSHTGDNEGSLGLRGPNALGLQRTAEEAVSRTRIVADPSIATAFSRTEDRELWELFLQ